MHLFSLSRSEPYPSMKLMFVGVANIGKTTLLNQLRQEGTGSFQNSPPVGWSDRKLRKRRSASTIGEFLSIDFNEVHPDLFQARNLFIRRERRKVVLFYLMQAVVSRTAGLIEIRFLKYWIFYVNDVGISVYCGHIRVLSYEQSCLEHRWGFRSLPAQKML